MRNVRYSTYEIPYLMVGRLTAFAGVATSEVVLRNEKKEWFLRKASVKWRSAAQLAEQLRPQEFSAPGNLGLARD